MNTEVAISKIQTGEFYQPMTLYLQQIMVTKTKLLLHNGIDLIWIQFA